MVKSSKEDIEVDGKGRLNNLTSEPSQCCA